jgi:ABC-2 type transport system ATP-binding protein
MNASSSEQIEEPSAVPALEIRGLVKAFRPSIGRRRREILHAIDLTVAPGESLGLVGPNGSGKTTLLKIVAGIEPASGGIVRTFGEDPETSRARRRIGYLAETSPFPEELSPLGILDLVGSLHGMARAERRRRAAELLERVGLANDAKRALRRFSKGMLRRFALAECFLHRPDLVLLDEPTAGLDAQGYPVLEEFVREASERGASIVLCSHILSDVVDHCPRLAVLIEGRIAAIGTPLEIAGSEGRIRIEIEGIDERGAAAAERAIVAEGGRVISRSPAPGSLIEIYRRFAPPRRAEETGPAGLKNLSGSEDPSGSENQER